MPGKSKKITKESDKTVILIERRLIHLRIQMTVTGDQYIRGGGDMFTRVLLNLTFFGNEAVVKIVWCHLEC